MVLMFQFYAMSPQFSEGPSREVRNTFRCTQDDTIPSDKCVQVKKIKIATRWGLARLWTAAFVNNWPVEEQCLKDS